MEGACESALRREPQQYKKIILDSRQQLQVEPRYEAALQEMPLQQMHRGRHEPQKHSHRRGEEGQVQEVLQEERREETATTGAAATAATAATTARTGAAASAGTTKSTNDANHYQEGTTKDFTKVRLPLQTWMAK